MGMGANLQDDRYLSIFLGNGKIIPKGLDGYWGVQCGFMIQKGGIS